MDHPLRVLQVCGLQDAQLRAPQQLLVDWATTPHIAEAAQAAGVDVAVLQQHREHCRVERAGIGYHFLPLLNPSGAGLSPACLQLLAALRPQVLHLHGLGFGALARALAQACPGVPLVIQHHAERVATRPWLWWRQRQTLALARGFMVCAPEQAQAFARRRALGRACRVYEVVESSCHFEPRDRAAAQARTGLRGSPCLLWLGHLNANKDPLTVLDGIERASERLPGLQLWMCFGEAPLLAEVKARVAGSSLLGRVHLMGRVPHAEVEWLLSAADILVQGSHHEGSGYAVIEALACGTAPVVTRIPSFRALVGDCPAAQLWPTGDAAALADALVAAAAWTHEDRRRAVRARFDAALSPQQLGRQLRSAYEDLLQP